MSLLVAVVITGKVSAIFLALLHIRVVTSGLINCH